MSKPKPYMMSFRRESGDSRSERFTDRTYALFDAMRDEHQRTTGKAFEGGNGILVANDVLVALHGAGASWSLFDVETFERWVHDQLGGIAVFLPAMMIDLEAFTTFLARRGVLDPVRAEATAARARELAPPAERRRIQPGVIVDLRAELGEIEREVGPNRAERRAMARQMRRSRTRGPLH